MFFSSFFWLQCHLHDYTYAVQNDYYIIFGYIHSVCNYPCIFKIEVNQVYIDMKRNKHLMKRNDKRFIIRVLLDLFLLEYEQFNQDSYLNKDWTSTI